ncbi:MAG: NAD(P)H-hydrate dehydratase [Pyrodictiaceae archaeon]
MLGFSNYISSIEMRIIDRNSAGLGVSSLMLMENAGRSVADLVEKVLGDVKGKDIVVFAGAGGNAGDGLTAARHLASRGARVRVYLLTKPSELRGEETVIEYQAVEHMDLSIEIIQVREEKDIPDSIRADAVIDALLGIGVKGRVRSLYAKAIEAINSSQGVKVAVDVPSGLDPDTGKELGPVVRADYTVTFHKPKKGLIGREEYTGRLVVASIGIPREAEIYVGPGDLEFRLTRRDWRSHKGSNGRVLVIGGSEDYTGAPALAAQAAYYAGVDLVVIAAPRRAADIIASFTPTMIAVRLEGHDNLHPDHLSKLRSLMEKADAIALGMGLGLSKETGEAVRAVVEEAIRMGKKLVVDADGLKHLAGHERLLSRSMILTPHAGELRILFGVEPPPPERVIERARLVEELARRHGNVTILFKGPVDVISDGETTRLNKTGSPLMAVGGTGDLLAGLAAAFLAQGLEPVHAASLAAFVNGVAGGLAYREYGDHASTVEILAKIPEVFRNPMEAFKKSLVYSRLPLERIG